MHNTLALPVDQGPPAPSAPGGGDDLVRLRAVIDGLTGLVQEIDLDQAVAGSTAPVRDQPRVAGMRAVRSMAMRRRGQAVAQLARLQLQPLPPSRPVVLDPADLGGAVLSRQGQPLTPVITAGAAPTVGLSSAHVWMPPGHTSLAHLHHHTCVGVLVLQGRAITLWWDEDGEMHELPQGPGQHLYIPPGVPHAAINPHAVPVVAAEFRANPVFHADNDLLPYLDPQVAVRGATVGAA